jgi:hypothetical protein
MLQQLEDLSHALNMVSEEDARSIIGHINARLKSVTHAQIIDVYYKEEAREDQTILRPLSSLATPGLRDEAMPWPISLDTLGIWPKAYFEKKAVWLEQIKAARAEQSTAENLLGGASDPESQITTKDLGAIFAETDSLVCLPLVLEQAPVGFFCIEASRSGVLTEQSIKFLRRLSHSYACLAWKVSASRVNEKQTRRAIDHFKSYATEDVIRDHLSFSGRGIMLRPFGEGHNAIQQHVSDRFAAHGVELRHFISAPGRPIIDDLTAELRLAPFAVVDITGLNANVLIELGMVKWAQKEIMLLRRKDDAGDLPFDIRTNQVDQYEIVGNVVQIEEAGTGSPVPLEDRVATFLDRLRGKGIIQ